MIKVLVVDDSTFIRKVISQLIITDPEITVVATAGDGQEAVEKVRTLNPDVVLMDIIMPMPDGLWALEEIMKQNPTPVIIVSSVANAASDVVEQAYSLGVVDVIQKPENPQQMYKISQELITKIKSAAKIDKTRLVSRALLPKVETIRGIKFRAYSVVVIGSSAGGPVSLDEVLPKIPKDFPAGIIVAQHIPEQFLTSYVEYLNKKCYFPVRIASNGDIIQQGRILFSPCDRTVQLARTKKGAVVRLTKIDARLCPDIDSVFVSCAEVFRANTIGVVLSGMSGYGVKGAKAIKQSGGKIIVEDKLTASINGMPQGVISAGLADWVLPSYNIPEALTNILSGRTPLHKEFRAKGIIFQSVKRFAESRNPEYGWENILNLVDEEVRKEFSGGILKSMFYSQSSYIQIHQALEEHFGSDAIEQAGELVVELESNNIYPRFFAQKYRQIQDFFSSFSGLTTLFSDGVQATVKEVKIEEGKAVLEISGADLRKESAQIMLKRGKGTYKKLLQKLGAKNVLVSGNVMRIGNGFGVEYVIEWKV